MITKLTFGALKVTKLTLGETRLKVINSTPAISKLTMINVGLPGKDGEPAEVADFTTDPVAYYILSKN